MTDMFETTSPNPHFPDVSDVTPNALWARLTDVCIVDVRAPEEFAGELGRVPGARLLTLNELPERLGELPENQTIVFVCRSGGRSAQAASFARTKGFAKLYNMAGGMLAWNELGLDRELGA